MTLRSRSGLFADFGPLSYVIAIKGMADYLARKAAGKAPAGAIPRRAR